MRQLAQRFGLVLGLFFLVTAQAAASPAERVEQLNAALLDVMKNADTLGFDGRLARLSPKLKDLFDFNFMGRVAVGAYWSRLDEAQRKTLIDEFSKLSIATYADRFSGYDGEKFEIVSAEKSVRDTMLVKTNLVKSDGTPVALNYLLRQSGDAWRIIDIFLDARFSELARMRADYTAVMKQGGFDALIATIKSKVAAMGKPNNG